MPLNTLPAQLVFRNGQAAWRLSGTAFGLASSRANPAGDWQAASYASFWLKALTQPSIDLTLPTHAGCGRGLSSVRDFRSLRPTSKTLTAQLRVVAARPYQRRASPRLFSGEREPMSRAVVTLICEEATGRPIAFNAFCRFWKPNLTASRWRSPILVSSWSIPRRRGQGLSWVLYGLTALVLFARGGIAFGMDFECHPGAGGCRHGRRDFSDVFPSPRAGARQSFAHLQLRARYLRRHRAVFGVGLEAGFDEAALLSPTPIPADRMPSKSPLKPHQDTGRAIQRVLRART